ncbi:izumo sperm-egg fusion protein 1 [Varanus komodoensis]|uniref:izumo sperm-egg fusion protein 1 n=1 Tax=Varanus komodoensis TaxID=61221 RepID=UPI001CF776A1|nr:izumo sperm-egg fusion protein 1 [Varanus komodoensis]
MSLSGAPAAPLWQPQPSVMSGLVFWLTALTIPGSHSCLKCSWDAMAVLREFKDRYLETKLRRDPELKTKLDSLLDNTVETLSYQPIDLEKYMGVIDEFTLGKLTTYFKRFVNQIIENDFEDGQLYNEVSQGIQRLLDTFKDLMPKFTKIYCSNECGRMLYTLISCYSCKTNQHSCYKNIQCGERRMQVELDEDLILDCALTWHKQSHGVKRYNFYRVVNGKKQLLASGPDPFLVKKEANINDTGSYQCEMLAPDGFPASQLDFQVVVLTSVRRTTWFPRPHTVGEGPLTLGVSSRAPPPQADWTVWIVIGSTGGLLIIIIVMFLCYYRRNNEEDDSSDEEEGESKNESGSESESSEMVEM